MKPIKVTRKHLRQLRKESCDPARTYVKSYAHPREAWEHCESPSYLSTALEILERDCSSRANDLRHARIRVRLLTRLSLSDGSTVASHLPESMRFLLDTQIAFLRSRISKAQMNDVCAGFRHNWDTLQKGPFHPQYVPDLGIDDLCVFASSICSDYDWTFDVIRHIDREVDDNQFLFPRNAHINARICAVLRDCVPLEFESEVRA